MLTPHIVPTVRLVPNWLFNILPSDATLVPETRAEESVNSIGFRLVLSIYKTAQSVRKSLPTTSASSDVPSESLTVMPAF